jgi:hypothetical protein
MRKLIALTLTALACSSALALSAYLNNSLTSHGDSSRISVAFAPVPMPSGAIAEIDNSRECSVEEGVLFDCIFN